MINFNVETQRLTLCGQEFALEYFQRVQAPLLVDALHWSPETLVNWMEAAKVPLGQFARVPKVQTFLIKRQEERDKAHAEQLERERWAHYNSPEQVAKRAAETARVEESNRRHAANRLSASTVSVGTHAATTMFDMYSST